jgi:imidazolonepropionase-like amidohydrolase
MHPSRSRLGWYSVFGMTTLFESIGVVAALACAASLSAQVPAPLTAVRFGSLVDGTGRVVRDAVVVTNADTIVSVATGAGAIPRGARVIDLRRYTGIPGMIDAHTHISYYWDQSPGSDPWQQSGRRRSQVTVFLAQENARKTLETGVTTIRDLGASEYSDLAIRDLIARGAMVGPRVFGAGYGLRRAPATTQPNAPPGPPRGRLTGVDDVAAAVKAQVDAGADVIKVYGSTGSGADVTGRETLTYDEMKAIVDAAHASGKRVAIHSYGPDGGRDAVRAGAESLEHAIDLDDSTLVRMVSQGTFYVPTIDHNRYYAEYARQFNYTPAQVAALDSFRLRNIETARRAFKAGVKFAMGSDAVFTMFGQNTRELGWYAEIGMTPAQALATATTNGATLLGMEKKLGAVAPGYFADIVAVEGDPLSDIRVVIDRVRWVMKGGQVVVDNRR